MLATERHVELPFPIAEIDGAGVVTQPNPAWLAMRAAARSAGESFATDTGVLTLEADRLAAAVAQVLGDDRAMALELDVPNLGLLRWSRVYVTPAGDHRALVAIVPLRRLAAEDEPDPDEFVHAYEYLSEGIVVLDADMRIRVATGFTSNFLGNPGYAYEGRGAIDELHPADREPAAQAFLAILDRPGEQVVLDVRLLDSDTTYRWVEVVATNLFDHPKVRGILVMLRDIVARKEAELRAGRLERLLDASPDIVVVFDLDGAPIYGNAAAIQAAGPDATEPDLRVDALQELIRRLRRQLPPSVTVDGTTTWEGEVSLSPGGGETRTYSVVAVNAQRDDEPAFLACVGRDITDRKRLEAELAHRALHDPLTGLPNRAALLDRLGRLLREQPSADHSLAVMFLDLDNLKDVNDSVGHEAGDELLVEVARRLRAATRPSDVVSRLGGDEFVVLCPHLPDPTAAVEIAERIRQNVTGRSVVDRTDVFLSVSIGVTVVPPRREIESSPADDALRLVRDADTAMYDAKLHGRARVALFSNEMHERAHARLQLTAGLDRAIADGQLALVYQPIVDVASGRLTGLEALLRWHHPQLGLLTPGRFVELAEESGLIVPIGTWALDRAVADVATWRHSIPGARSLSVNVNVSARQLRQLGYLELVAATLLAHRVDSDALVLELTESTLVDEVTGDSHVIERLRELGVHIAIDDFGTGYSSLSYLRRFAADQLKLDGSFVEDLVHEPVNSAIVRAVIDMAHAIGMSVVAESVTSPEQLTRLGELGCDRAQGYYLGYPVPANEVPQALERFGALSR